MAYLTQRPRFLALGLASFVLLGARTAHADLPELFYDDFDDGDYVGWTDSSPLHISWGPPAIVPSPEGFAVGGVGQGYGQDPGLHTPLSHPISLHNVAELAIEMRAISGPGWPSSAEVFLFNDLDFYSGRDYGESFTRADFLIGDDGADTLVYSHSMTDPFDWHDFRWERDADGWWSFYLDGALIAADFHQHGLYTSFDYLEIYPLRDEGAIEWVRIRGNVIPGPGSIALLPLAAFAFPRRRWL